MAKNGCWSAMCEFTGTRTQSDATPGRCTNTSGYLAQAEINELVLRNGVRSFYDPGSNSDVIVYNGAYYLNIGSMHWRYLGQPLILR